MNNLISQVKEIISQKTGISELDLNENSKPYDFPQWDSLANLQIYMKICERIKKIEMEEYFDCKNIKEISELLVSK